MCSANSDQMVRAAWHCIEKVNEKEAVTEKMPSSIINAWHGHRIRKW